MFFGKNRYSVFLSTGNPVRGIWVVLIILLSSCSILEKASRHGFESGAYRFREGTGKAQPVYVQVTADSLYAFKKKEGGVSYPALRGLPVSVCADGQGGPYRFSRQSLDIDLTSVFFKYRGAVQQQPAQLTTDLNAALYAGWRFDTYTIKQQTDVLKQCSPKIRHRGFDAGILLGAGTAALTPFNTGGAIDYEYYGMVLQYGAAAFLESSFASFGVAVGFDYLTGPHRKVWIYQRRPWVGFVVGIALQ
jgi:hypothetical protein